MREEVLLLASTHNGTLSPATASALTCGQGLGPVVLLVAGADPRQGARLAGVAEVLALDDEFPAMEDLAALMVALAPRFSHLLAPADAWGRGVMPRVAAMLDAPMVSDVVAVGGKDTFTRPMHAGSLLATLRTLSEPVCLTIRPSAFPQAQEGPEAPITRLTLMKGEAPCHPLYHESRTASFTVKTPSRSGGTVESLPSPHKQRDLLTASVVIGGGIGIAQAGGFAALLPLADRLEGALAATRSAVDAGLAPNDWQVGQTGKVIAPQHYLALGLSGAIQHLAGIKDAGLIGAINRDPHAPIFAVADVGWVMDIETALPELIRVLEAEGKPGP